MCANSSDPIIATSLETRLCQAHETVMTDKTPSDKKSNPVTARNAAIGAAATIGSAAIAAALLYAGKRFRKKPEDSSNGSSQSSKTPSGEPPETD